MDDEFYEEYHKNGGTYELPVEIFNDLLEENRELKKQKNEVIKYCNDSLKELMFGFGFIPAGNILINIKEKLEDKNKL